MTLRAYKNKRDASEQSIVAALRKAGAAVCLIDKPCDAILHFRGRTHLAEFKTGRGKLTKEQERFFKLWPGPVYVIRTPEAAIEFLNGAGK